MVNGCSDEIVNNEIPDDVLVRPIIFLSGTTSLGSINSNEITTQKVEITKDVLIIDATYPGGCEVHSTALFYTSGFQESYPVQLPMKLVHYSFSDTCTKIIPEKLYFDFKSVAALYKIGYRTDVV